MEPLGYFIATILSLAVIKSMLYNSRRLETIGYALSIAFLQQLIRDNGDVLLICSQFPLYVSPKDNEPSPDRTLPDREARGVYVDHALLLPCPQTNGGGSKLVEIFTRAYKMNDPNLHHTLYISSLQVPLLEEKKRAPTRHPRDLEDHVWSILNALNDAQSQVTTQAKILFSSPRFATQDLVILIASSGEYYRLAVLQRGHPVLQKLPTSDEVTELLSTPSEQSDLKDVAKGLVAELVKSAHTPAAQEKQRLQEMEKAQKDETERKKRARAARLEARRERRDQLGVMDDLERGLSKIIDAAGDPNPDGSLYTDELIEAFYGAFTKHPSNQSLQSQRHATFFEPEPSRDETVITLSNLRDTADKRKVIFTGVIRLGSQTSNKFLEIVQNHLSRLARMERNRRG